MAWRILLIDSCKNLNQQRLYAMNHFALRALAQPKDRS
jgi:hypothetical protein